MVSDMTKKKKYIWLIISLVLIAIGVVVFKTCYNRGLIERGTLAKMMADIYLIDAVGQNKGNLYVSKNPDRYMENSYHTILKKYGTTKAEFDSTMVWYSNNPEEFSNLYDEVVGILSEREGRMNLIISKRDSISKRITSMRDSLKTKYWNYQRTIRLPLLEKDTVPKDLAFTFDMDSVRHGKIYLNMDYVFPRRNKVNDTMRVELVVCYNDTIADTILVTLERTHTMKHLDMTADVRDTISATKVVARLLKTKLLKQTTATFSNIDMYYMPYEVTDSVKFDEIQLPFIFAF